jgi:two-component SAPR family response regulator
MEHLSSEMEQQQNQQVQWRRDKVQELYSKWVQPKGDITYAPSWISHR